MSKSKRGFTLIELMLVMGMMAMLMVFLIPLVANFNKRRVLTEDARTIENGIKLAQSLADSGVKSPSGGTDSYRFSLLRGTGDAVNCYRGYQIVAANLSRSPILPVLEQKGLTCGIVMYSNWSQVYYQSESGKFITTDGSTSKSVRVCYPNQGYVEITIDSAGKVSRGDYIQSTSCGGCTTACGILIP